MNTVDYRPLLRAALVRLDRWVSAEEPPPSRYPRLSDGTAVLPDSTAEVFSGIPGMRFPAHLPRAARNDFGPEANRGIVTTLPPLPGKPYPCFVPAIDRDGNDVAGIRLPDLTVPLATHTGWNLRHPQIGASGQLLNLIPPKPKALIALTASHAVIHARTRFATNEPLRPAPDRKLSSKQLKIGDAILSLALI